LKREHERKQKKASPLLFSFYSPLLSYRDPAHPADAHIYRDCAELLGAVELFQGAKAVLLLVVGAWRIFEVERRRG
jgi:hypothetical protein